MFHLLKDKNNEYYWLGVVKKGNTYEVNSRSSESYTSKQNCKKSILNETKIGSLGDPDYGEAVFADHTLTEPTILFLQTSQNISRFGTIRNLETKSEKAAMKEIDFISNRENK